MKPAPHPRLSVAAVRVPPAFHDEGCFIGKIRPLLASERADQLTQQWRAEMIRHTRGRARYEDLQPVDPEDGADNELWRQEHGEPS